MSDPPIDTNVIIRFVTQDHPAHSARALALFTAVRQGDRRVWLPEPVVIETVQVLSSKALYAVPRATISATLEPIIRLRSVRMQHKRACLRALDLYASTNLDFVDVLLVAHMERTGTSTLISFDRDFDRIPGIQREEP
jgi:predicted nucleic acid-binding protein